MAHEPKIRWHPNGSPNGAWRSDVGPVGKNGRRRPVYFRFPNDDKGKDKAKRALHKYIDQRDLDEAQNRDRQGNLTAIEVVMHFLRRFRELVDEHERSETTLESHQERLNRFMKFKGPDGKRIGDRIARTLTDDDGAYFIEDLKKGRNWSARSIDGELRSINACFTWAEKRIPGRTPKQLIPFNPFKELKPGRIIKVRRELIPKKDMAKFLRHAWRDVNKFSFRGARRCFPCAAMHRKVARPCQRPHGKRSAYDRNTVLMCRAQYRCGTRPSELCRATWGPTELCPEAGWEPRARQDRFGHWWGLLTMHGKTTEKTSKLRLVPVRPALTRAIERWRNSEYAHPVWIFPRATRKPPNTWTSNSLGRRLRFWRNDVGLDENFVLYGMRATFYTRGVHDTELTGEQVGSVGGTSGNVVRDKYLQEDKDEAIKNAMKMDQARKE